MIAFLLAQIGKIKAAISSQSKQMSKLLNVEAVTDIPSETSAFYLTESKTIGDVTIDSYSMGVVWCYGTDGMGYIVKINGNGSPHVFGLRRTGGTWTNAYELKNA